MRVIGIVSLWGLLLMGCQRTPDPPPRRASSGATPTGAAPRASGATDRAAPDSATERPAAANSGVSGTVSPVSGAIPGDPALSPNLADGATAPAAALSAAHAALTVPLSADQQCAECHADLVASYAQHPMGRSLAAMDAAVAIEDLTESGANPFVRDGYRYQVVRDNGVTWHERQRLDGAGQAIVSERVRIDWAVGSGHHGRSYLAAENGRLRMSPLTWYPQRQRWDLSPGYASSNFGFQRPITEDCMYCHANRVVSVPTEMNAYATPIFFDHAAISCQRCHGAGETHVAARRLDGRSGDVGAPGTQPTTAAVGSDVDGNAAAAEGLATGAGKLHGSGNDVADPTIVNPGRLSPELRESVCQQCHVSGAARVVRHGRQRWDYQPGEPLSDTLRLYTVASAETAQEEFVGQAEQMVMSRCYEGSGGQLGCISCHDPHRSPAAEERVEFYRARCLTCHQVADCGIPTEDPQRVAVADSCYACHMPRRDTALQHVATTNHQIPREAGGVAGGAAAVGSPSSGPNTPAERASADLGSASKSPDRGAPAELRLPIREFPQVTSANGAGEWDRDLAVAVVATLGTFPERVEQRHLSSAAVELARAVEQQPTDLDAWQALAESYWRLQRLDKARQALQGLLKQSPQHEYGLATLANIDKQQQRWTQVEATYRQLAARDPQQARYRFEWAYSLSQLGQWDSCERVVQGAVEQFPLHVGLRQLQAAVHLQFGRREEAAEVMELLRRWQPAELAEIEAWYAELTSK